VDTLPSSDLEVRLSDEQVAEYHEQGFTHVERLTTDAEIEWLRDRFAEVFAPGNARLFGGYFDASKPINEAIPEVPDLGQSIRPELKLPELVQTIAHRNAVGIASQLLDVPVEGLETWTHMIDKPPQHGHETPWHQDEAFWEEHLGYHACGVWLALDDVDVDNGCMEFVPGSHTDGIVTHRHLYDDPMVSALVIDDVDPAQVVPIPLRAGGATFHSQRTMHHTGPNGTDRRRRAFAIEVQIPPYELAEPIPKPWKAF
jgi:ectoine hydroxylase-related dioxygenase (phytanoyl-CoA dioxygenase family)